MGRTKRHRTQASVMMPGMMPGMMPNGGMMESSSEDDERDRRAAAPAAPAAAPAPAAEAPQLQPSTEQTKISSSASCIRKVPRCHLSKTVATLCPFLDSSWTADLSPAGLMGLLYILTRIKPNSNLCDLGSMALCLDMVLFRPFTDG